MSTSAFTHQTIEAVALVGAAIRAKRKRKGWTAQHLADRVGVSRDTISKIERGLPSVAIGTVFETAVIVGVPLFSTDQHQRRGLATSLADQLALLPERTHTPRFDNDF